MADLFTMLQSPRDASLPPDWKERERALDVEQSWIVEAPAGSGKTGLLIQRYLRLLAHESVEQPEQVLAITFTVKATAEIRERVLKELEGAVRSETLKQDSDFAKETRALAEAVLRRDELLGWQLIDHPRRLNMRTIDSVCAQIARSLPVLADGGGQSPVLDAGLLYREAARQTLMQLGGNDTELDEALRTVLLHRDGNLAECERLIAEMLEWRDQWGELVPLGRELDDDYLEKTVLPKMQNTLEQAVCAGLAEFANAVPEDFLQALCSIASSLAMIEPYECEQSPIAICAHKTGLPSTNAEDLEHWRALIHLMVTPSSGTWRKGFAKNSLGFEPTKPEKKALKSLIEEVSHRDDLLYAIERVDRLPPAVYPQDQWLAAKALFRILSRALAELQIVFAQRGECDFAEPALLARAALTREDGVRDLSEALGIELRHLLVDEMQDTSTSQYELIELLTHGWDGRSQTVFLVGDPKQSIYLFRQARVERFVKTMQTKRLGDLPLESLQLTANFRSQSDLVDAFNEDFALLFPRAVSKANPEEVAYVAAEAVNGPSRFGAPGIVWHAQTIPSSTGAEQSKREKRRQSRRDAHHVKEIILDWRAKPLPWDRAEPWKIAVLVRSRGHLLDIVATLKEAAIPFRAVDIEPLKDRQEVLDLLALTRALLHPADRVAWLAVLHAPWCGLSLAELHLLTGADNDEWAQRSIQDVIEERGDLLSEDGCARLTKIWPVLDAAQKQRAKLTTAQWVERTWRSLGGDAALSEDELTNARRYLQLLDEVEEQVGTLDLSLLERRIGKLYAETTAVPGAVDLMTIHGAKGLEWDVVLVPGLERRAQGNRSRLLTWSEMNGAHDDAAQVMLAPIAGKGEGSKELNRWLNGIHNAREAAERKRLFYVACTRAREELHLFAFLEAKSGAELKPASGTLLQTAWAVAKRHFDAPAPVASANLIAMPQQLSLPEDMFIGSLAAEADPKDKPARLMRLPRSFDPTARLHIEKPLFQKSAEDATASVHFIRPEGSFEARAFGNAVHAFLDLLTKKLADRISPVELLREVTQWSLRIASLLRADGLPRASLDELTVQVQTALENTLRSTDGLWILQAREEASSEFALTTWNPTKSSVRLDRIFRAGESPTTAGNDYLWIVDYKTATHSGSGLEEFLAKERKKYEPQMHIYAQMMRSSAPVGKLRIALFYPLLSRLIWWTPETS